LFVVEGREDAAGWIGGTDAIVSKGEAVAVSRGRFASDGAVTALQASAITARNGRKK
jgi:hypothetical protein